MAFPFADVGAVNEPDAGGEGSPAPESPSVATPSFPSPANPPVDLTHDPRYQMVLQRLQPPPQPSGWEAALRQVLPALGAYVAMQNGGGGAYVNAMEGLKAQQAAQRDKQVADDYRLASILHQQAQEAEATRRTNTNLQIAQTRAAAAAAKDAAAKRDKLMRDEWTSQSQGGLVDTINHLIDTQGPEAADRYMASANIGSLTEAGVPHTVKDLVDRYAVKGPDGHYIGGKTKTDKAVTAGSKEEYVLRARDLATQAMGHQLSDEQQQKVDETALKRYADLTKDTDTAAVLKGLQVDTARLHNQLLQQELDKSMAEKYGSTPTWMYDGEGKIHAYFVKKDAHGRPQSIFELSNPGLLPDVSKVKPNAFMAWWNSEFGSKTPPPPVKIMGGGTDPTDPNWGK